MNSLKLLIIATILVTAQWSMAAFELTYNGRLLNPDGDPAPATNIYLRFDLKTVNTVAGQACYLFQQMQTTVPTQTDQDGVFQSLLTGTGAVYGPANLDSVFDMAASRPCYPQFGGASTGAIAAGSSEILELVVYFRLDPVDGWDEIDRQTIRPAIEAVNAQKLAGKLPNAFIQVNGSANQANFEGLLQATDFSKVLDYAQGGNLDMGAGQLINLPTPTAAHEAVNKEYADETIAGKSAAALSGLAAGDSGKILKWSGTDWVASSVTDSGGLSLAGGTMTGSIDMGGNDISNVGHLIQSSNHFLMLSSNAATPSGIDNSYRGAIWYDSVNDVLKYQSSTDGVIRPLSSLMSVSASAPLTYAQTGFTGNFGVNTASTTAVGVVMLATDGTADGTKALASNDSRLTNSRSPSGAAGADLSGAYPNPTVAKLQGQVVSAGVPTLGQTLVFSAGTPNQWVPRTMTVDLLVGTTGVAQFPKCGVDKVMTWHSTLDYYVCSDISIGNTQVTGIGTAALRDVGTTAGDVVQLQPNGKIETALLEETVIRHNGNDLSANLVIGTNDTSAVILETNNAAAITVLGNGNVGIGTGTPSEKLEVSGNIHASGEIQGQTLITTSDGRLKEDVRSVAGLELILQLKAHRFRWKTDQSADIGFIAQEVEAVEPDLVVTNAQTGLKGVKYSNMTAPLVQATQELYGICRMAEAQSERLQRAWAEKFSRLEAQSAVDRAALSDMALRVQKIEQENQLLRQDLEDLKQSLKRLAR